MYCLCENPLLSDPNINKVRKARLDLDFLVVQRIFRTAPDGGQVLFGEGFPTNDGRGKLVPCEFEPPREPPDAQYPFVLNTGRLLEHWHTGTMTRRSYALDALAPEAFVEVNPEDAARL